MTSSINVILIIKLIIVIRFEIDNPLKIKINDLKKIILIKEKSRLLIY